MDPRHEKRLKIIQELYPLSFNRNESAKYQKKTLSVVGNEAMLSSLIRKYAQKFPIDKVAKVDLAILKLAVYELVVEKAEPPKVIIDEAVELAKELGSDKSYSFINAVLGKIYQENKEIKSGAAAKEDK